VSAIEMSRLVPSVAAALSLAAAFGCSVEALFCLDRPAHPEPGWAWPPPQTPYRYWEADVRGRILRYPVEATAVGVLPHDGVYSDEQFQPSRDSDPADTLVLASCDPAAGLLAAEFRRATGLRLLVLPRSSRQALTLLGEGLVHVAGVHFATAEEPAANEQNVEAALGPGHHLLRVARWQEGLSVAPARSVQTVEEALRARLRWVGREPGSAARQCLDELLPGRPPPRRLAHDHRGVALAVRCGWADIGVCHRLASDEAGLRFLGIREEYYDLCYAAADEADPRLQALLQTVRHPDYRRPLGELPGFDTAQVGEMRSVS
jgi:molybdate-binding protein